MKTVSEIIICVLIILNTSCSKDSPAVTNEIVGKWSITTFTDNGMDKTNEFKAYQFTFDKQGNLAINGGGMMNMCHWTCTNNTYHFDMMGMHNNSLNDLDGNWMMTDFSDSTCMFADDNPNRDCTFTMHKW